MLALWLGTAIGTGAETVRSQRFAAQTPAEARQWQARARETLVRLMMGGARPAPVPLGAKLLGHEQPAGRPFHLEEWSIQTLADRRAHAWVAIPKARLRKAPGVLALHGHGGSGEQVIRGESFYWYGPKLAELGCVVIAPDIGQHTLQHTNWSLMGERTWDTLCCLDYLVSRPEVDPDRLAVAGLSLGGETAMYVAALDTRVQAACSSGWLTTIQNMKRNHCPCWHFPGLESHFDFADVFACVAPRPIVFEIGEKERAPGGFPLDIARGAFAEVQAAYGVFGAATNAVLAVHPGGHVFHGERFWSLLQTVFGPP